MSTFKRPAQLPRIAPQPVSSKVGMGVATAGGDPHIRPHEDGSITALKALMPIRVATGRVLDGPWSGAALDAHRVIPSLFGGKHFILQLGYMSAFGAVAEEVHTFRLVFVVNLPIDEKDSLDDPTVRADAGRTAEALLHMLNLRRTA